MVLESPFPNLLSDWLTIKDVVEGVVDFNFCKMEEFFHLAKIYVYYN